MTLPQSVLIVDDEPNWAEMMCRLLINHFPGARIISQNTFAEPLPPVDVVGLDLYLKCDWMDTLQSLMARKRNLPPVVCFSGKADSLEAMVASMQHGAQDFISKERAVRDPVLFAEKLTLAFLRDRAAHS